MAPSITETTAVNSSYPKHLKYSPSNAPKSIFPDGIKTAGQHPPIYEQLAPWSAFPEEITGPTVWRAEDYKNNPERWVHPFTEEEIEEMSEAADQFIASKTPLTGISKVSPGQRRYTGMRPS